MIFEKHSDIMFHLRDQQQIECKIIAGQFMPSSTEFCREREREEMNPSFIIISVVDIFIKPAICNKKKMIYLTL